MAVNGGGARGAVPAAVVIAVLSAVVSIVSMMAGQAKPPAEEMDRFYMPRAELERRLGEMDRKRDAQFWALRELILRRVK